ncbi:MAG: DUF427 domain-containing protein [Myxococcota bacterium]
MSRRESLYHQYPDYRVDLEPNDRKVTVTLDGRSIAESRRTLIVRETKHAPVVYFPREDVRADRLEATDHHTFCPFKGEASYWTLRVGDRALPNSVWSYEEPFPEVSGLENYMSFTEDLVEWEYGDPAPRTD